MITGVGPVSAAGLGRHAFWDALAAGRSGIGEITLFDAEPYRARHAAELQHFRVEDYLRTPKTYLDRASEISFAALELAIRDAGLDPGAGNWEGAGLAFGTALGAQGTAQLFFDGFLAKGPRLVKPVLFPNTYANTAVSLLAIEYKIGGPHLCFTAGCVSAAAALAAAFDWIRAGRAELVFAGGVDALSEVALAGCEQAGWLSPGEGGEEHCAPFDRDRNGFVLGEAGAMLVLESEEHARRRGAPSRGELLAAALGAAPPGRAGDSAAVAAALTGSMRAALSAAGRTLRELDWIVATANGSILADRAEADALMACGVGTAPPVSSLKGMTGETLGAAAALALCAACSAGEHGLVPATVGLHEPDAATAGALPLVRDGAVARPVNTVLMNAADPGGAVATLIMGRADA